MNPVPNKTTTADIKAALLNEFQRHAALRRQKAADSDQTTFAFDDHNTIYATSLDRVIAYIEALPDDAPAFQKLLACKALHDEGGGFMLPRDAGHAIANCGSCQNPLAATDAEQWFEDWVGETTVERRVPHLWTFDETATDMGRLRHLHDTPCWDKLVQEVCAALRAAIEGKNARFGVEESCCASQDLRYKVQFPLGTPLFDWFFNGTTGYRGQFRTGPENGLAKNAQLIRGDRSVGTLRDNRGTHSQIHLREHIQGVHSRQG